MTDFKEKFTGPSLGVPTIEPEEFNEFKLVSEILKKHLGLTDQMIQVSTEIYDVMHKSRMYWWRTGCGDTKAIYGINREVEE